MNEEARQYIDAVPEGKAHFEQLHALIMALYPDAVIGMSYQMPTYKAKSGWVAVGYWKKGVSLYTNGSEYVKKFIDKHPAFNTDGGSINFKVTDAIPVPDIKKIIRHAFENPAVELTTQGE
jgi:uncharacterized protein YdhG (YjbR/CyaY superfamily)